MIPTASKNTPKEAAKQEGNMQFKKMMDFLYSKLLATDAKLPKNELSLMDIGAREMFYGEALLDWMRGKFRRTTLQAVDPYYALQGHRFIPDPIKPIFKIGKTIEEAVRELEYLPDVLTLFNSGPYEFNAKTWPQIFDAFGIYRRPIIGSMTSPYVVIAQRKELERQLYDVSVFDNPFPPSLSSPIPYSYEIVFVAVPGWG